MARDRKFLAQLERRLCRSAWGKGVYTEHFQVPSARPAQIRAGAKKLYDQLIGSRKRAQHGA
jgi:hypothetical protein